MIGIQQPQASFTEDDGAAANEVVQLHLTDSERIEFQKAAERCGLSLSAWMRGRLNECARREAKEA
jgi:hypothetical protein